jgi:CubicO group peptidase (beta-lactamase class C family)
MRRPLAATSKMSLPLLLSVSAAAICGACHAETQAPAGPLAAAANGATGLVSQTLCGETFVAGLDPDQAFAESIRPTPGISAVAPMIHYQVDRQKRAVTATLAGAWESRAVYHEGYGCQLDYGSAPSQPLPPPPQTQAAATDDLAGPAVVEPTDQRLKDALDRTFAEQPGSPIRATKAVVVVYNGKIIAERYAPGFGVDTPLISWSVAKSVVNALTGILVGEGRLKLDEPAPIAAWSSPTDPRRAITIEELMRMTSGLDLDETNTGFDANSRMQYTEPDMAGFAEQADLKAAPGTRWFYSSPTTLILSRIIRDQVGGTAADVRAFAERELFEPLGMRNVTMEFDSAGDMVGASSIYATARDWARFGLLYANDGVVGGRRILPEGWVAYSGSPTAGSSEGYAAGFFTARGDSDIARIRVKGGMAPDALIASGSLGQRIVIEPAEHLVILRFGRSQDWPGFDGRGLIRLVADVNAAVGVGK